MGMIWYAFSDEEKKVKEEQKPVEVEAPKEAEEKPVKAAPKAKK